MLKAKIFYITETMILQAGFSLVITMELVINFGYNYYTSETLYEHDTSYSPDGQDVNPREDYTFKDANEAINQPEHQLKALVGFNHNIR